MMLTINTLLGTILLLASLKLEADTTGTDTPVFKFLSTYGMIAAGIAWISLVIIGLI